MLIRDFGATRKSIGSKLIVVYYAAHCTVCKPVINTNEYVEPLNRMRQQPKIALHLHLIYEKPLIFD